MINHTKQIFFRSDEIVAIGTDDQIAREFEGIYVDKMIDASGCCILPGFVDAHTHPIWAGDRVHEYAKKVGFVELSLNDQEHFR